MLEHLRIRDVGPARDLKLDFATRLSVLTGDNGIGKSFLLDIAWWALAGHWPGNPAWPRRGAGVEPTIELELTGSDGRSVPARSRFRFNDQTWEPIPRPTPRPGLVLYARVDGSFSVWDPARNFRGPTPPDNGDQPPPHRYRPPAYHFTSQQIRDGLSDNGRVLSNGIIRDWVSWQRGHESAFAQLRQVLRSLSAEEPDILEPGEPTRVWIDDVRDIPTLKAPYGDVPLTLTSAGVQRIVALAYLLVWTWQEHLLASKLLNQPPENRILFLIDELEAHLHPRWQRTLLPALLPIAGELFDASAAPATCQIVTATHAPLVMASLEPVFDPEKDGVYVLEFVGSDVEVSKDPWRPRGDASAWLTSEVFDLAQARSLPAEKAIAEAMEAMKRPDLKLEEARRIHTELHRVLKDSDPFWVRWRYRAEQAGLET